MDEIDEEEVEDDRALLPLTCEGPDLDTDGWGKSEDGKPVKSDETVVTGVAVEGCVGDEDAAPVDF